jgi:hypothetical protein
MVLTMAGAPPIPLFPDKARAMYRVSQFQAPFKVNTLAACQDALCRIAWPPWDDLQETWLRLCQLPRPTLPSDEELRALPEEEEEEEEYAADSNGATGASDSEGTDSISTTLLWARPSTTHVEKAIEVWMLTLESVFNHTGGDPSHIARYMRPERTSLSPQITITLPLCNPFPLTAPSGLQHLVWFAWAKMEGRPEIVCANCLGLTGQVHQNWSVSSLTNPPSSLMNSSPLDHKKWSTKQIQRICRAVNNPDWYACPGCEHG